MQQQSWHRKAVLDALALAATLAPATVTAQTTPAGDWRTEVVAFAERIVQGGLTPGMGVAVARGDRVEYVGGFGLADLDTDRAVDRATPFYIASSTKSLTALAAVLAAYRGDLDLNAPLSRYLPELRLRPPLSAGSIRVEDLLTLTHGIADGGPVVFRTAYSGEFSRMQLFELLGEYLPSEAGRTFVYGNLGYNILAFVLEARFGIGWKEVVERSVLRPLGMDATTAYVSRVDRARIAQPHAGTPDGFRRIPLGKADENMHAAGGHFATARDLARYLAAHQSGGLLEGRRVFPREPVIATHRAHADQERQFGPFHRFGWGYGWDLGLYEGDTLVHRFGGFRGYRSHMSFMPTQQLGVAVLVNGDGPASPAADLMATYIYDRLLGKPNLAARQASRLEKLATRARETRRRVAAELVERRARQAPLPRRLQEYEGTYENRKLGRMVWRVVGEALEVRMGVARSRAEVYDAATNKLRVELTGRGDIVEFLFPESGGPAEAVRYRGEAFARVVSVDR